MEKTVLEFACVNCSAGITAEIEKPFVLSPRTHHEEQVEIKSKESEVVSKGGLFSRPYLHYKGHHYEYLCPHCGINSVWFIKPKVCMKPNSGLVALTTLVSYDIDALASSAVYVGVSE